MYSTIVAITFVIALSGVAAMKLSCQWCSITCYVRSLFILSCKIRKNTL